MLQILTTSLIHFSLKGWENVLFSEGLNSRKAQLRSRVPCQNVYIFASIIYQQLFPAKQYEIRERRHVRLKKGQELAHTRIEKGYKNCRIVVSRCLEIVAEIAFFLKLSRYVRGIAVPSNPRSAVLCETV